LRLAVSRIKPGLSQWRGLSHPADRRQAPLPPSAGPFLCLLISAVPRFPVPEVSHRAGGRDWPHLPRHLSSRSLHRTSPGGGGLQVWPREPRVNLRWRLMNGCHPGLEHTGLLPTRLTHGPGQLLNVARPGRGDLPETDNAVSLPSEMHRVARQPLNRGGDSQAGSEDSTIAQHGSQSSPWAGVVGLGSSARPGRLAGGSMPPQLLPLGPSASAGRWSPFSTLFTAL
jgi:hypothetical protein